MADLESRSRSSRASWDPLAAEFEPLPRIGILQAALRHWWLVLLPVVILVPIVGIVAAKRTPTYTAESRLMVGRLNVSTPGAIDGYTQAILNLTTSYPLVITADAVVQRVSRDVGVSPVQVENDLSATQVPSSQVIRLDAKGKSSTQAIRLVNAATDAVVGYIASINGQNPDLSRRFNQLKQAELKYQQALANAPGPPTDGQPLDAHGQKLEAAAQTARVQVNAAVTNYENSLQNTTVDSLVQPIAYANMATSDAHTKLEIALFIALVAGLVMGLGLATLRANMLVRRALLAPSDWTADVPLAGGGVDGPLEGPESEQPPSDVGTNGTAAKRGFNRNRK